MVEQPGSPPSLRKNKPFSETGALQLVDKISSIVVLKIVCLFASKNTKSLGKAYPHIHGVGLVSIGRNSRSG